MVFYIGDRDYEPYQLSNNQLVGLLKTELTDEQRKVLTDKLLERFEYSLCPKAGENEDNVFASFFASFVNGKMHSREKVAELMANEHRYLQNEMFKVCLAYMKKLAENYNNGRFDARNEYACQLSSAMVGALKDLDLPF